MKQPFSVGDLVRVKRSGFTGNEHGLALTDPEIDKLIQRIN